MRRYRRLLLVVLAVFVAGVSAISALADGAKSISGATPIAFGQQQFGNMANGQVTDVYQFSSHWALFVRAGDRVTIDWETQCAESCGTSLSVYPTGTNDFNIGNTSTLENQLPDSAGRNELVFTAPRTGVMPTVFFHSADRGPPGPYNFTAYVKHAVRLALPRSSRLRRRGTVKVKARTPDGGTITDPALKVKVQIMTRGRWRTVGSASVANSTAAVRVRIARRLRGRKVRMRARASGAGYVTRTTASRRVRIR